MTQPNSPRQTPPASSSPSQPGRDRDDSGPRSASRREPSRDAQREEQRRKGQKPSEHRDVTDRDRDTDRSTPNEGWTQ